MDLLIRLLTASTSLTNKINEKLEQKGMSPAFVLTKAENVKYNELDIPGVTTWYTPAKYRFEGFGYVFPNRVQFWVTDVEKDESIRFVERVF